MTDFTSETIAAENEIHGPRPERWYARLDREREQLNQALRKWLEHDIARGLELAGAVWPFWGARGHVPEGREWLSRLLAAAPAAVRSAGRAKALYGAGTLAFIQGERNAAYPLHEESLAIARELGNRGLEADALIGLARVALLDLDAVKMEEMARASRTAAVAAGDPGRVATALHHVAEALRRQRRYKEVLPLYHESIEVHSALGNRRGVALELHNLGNVARLTGDSESAALKFRESLTLARELLNRRLAAYCLLGLAHLAVGRGDWSQAARCLGASDSLFAEAGVALDPDYREDQVRTRSACESALGPPTFAAELAAGAVLGLEAGGEPTVRSPQS